MKASALSLFTVAALALLLSPHADSQVLSFTQVPVGYEAGSIDLDAPFAGALAAHPSDPGVLYASVGGFQDQSIVRIELPSGTVQVVAAGPFGAVGGIVVLSETRLILVDNSEAPSMIHPGETILLASDGNTDGDFDDAGEITELIAPILVGGGGFTGTQARLAPSGDPSGIPSGSILVQTSDGGGNSELLVIENPLGSPAFRPTGAAYASGFDYNGGFDFDSLGRILMGTVTSLFSGEIIALVNTDLDEDIDAGESNVMVGAGSLPAGLSDLILDGADNGFCVSGSDVLTFPIPPDPLSQTASTAVFAETDASFLSGIMISSKTLSFEPGTGPDQAVLVFGGYTGGFAQGTNLLTLTPADYASVEDWEAYGN